MRKILIALFSVVFLAALAGCAKNVGSSDEINNSTSSTVIRVDNKNVEPGEFRLLSPVDGVATTFVPTFSWTKSENAQSYTLEVCSTEEYSMKDSTYIKKTGIETTSYNIGANLSIKEYTYYWRVTAVCGNKKLTKSSSFYLDSVKGEVAFEVGAVEDWAVHKEGSQATLSVDNNDFFGNGKPSLGIAFTQEDTKRGVESSDGWIVITKSQEVESYGVDSFYLNLYYSGNDSDIYFRVVDEDNEYWNVRLKVAKNSKQTIIVKFDEFDLRTKGGTTIANEKFDYHHIRAVELVYEKTFGDGVTYISDIKAIKYSDYEDLFISDVDFSDYDSENYTYENCNNESIKSTVIDDGSAINLAYRVQGYGIVKIPTNRLLVVGDAFQLDVNVTGENKASFLIRIIEEDGDRWSYEQKFSTIKSNGKLIIPFKAFTLSEAKGDGARQFSYVKSLQLGVKDTYSQGEITLSNMKVVLLADVIDNLFVGSVSENGVIDDFDGYANAAQIYYVWQSSDVNKDEAMKLDNTKSRKNNGNYVVLGYKTDMYSAVYGVEFQPVEGYSAISILLADNSVKSDKAEFKHLKNANAQAKITLYVSQDDMVQTYGVNIPEISKEWTIYTFAFTDFKLDEGYYNEQPFTSENIIGVSVEIQYFYKDKNGNPLPQYIPKQEVYLDNLKFTNDESSSTQELEPKLKPSADNKDICVVDDCESLKWENLSADNLYSGLALSNNTESGEGTCVEMKYRGNQSSVSYKMYCALDQSVKAKGMRIKIYSDGKAKVMVNFFFVYDGKQYKYRATIETKAGWHEYVIGFGNANFQKEEGPSDLSMDASIINEIDAFSFGIVNYKDNEESAIRIDDFKLDNSIKWSTRTIDGEDVTTAVE